VKQVHLFDPTPSNLGKNNDKSSVPYSIPNTFKVSKIDTAARELDAHFNEAIRECNAA
jgi:hypothetical protein